MSGADPVANRLAAAASVSGRRAEILAAAVECLARFGYDRVRLRDVSRESGVSVGSIQHYFETREALLEEAFGVVSETLIERWSEVVEGEHPDPWARIAGLVDQAADDPHFRRRCITWTQFCVVASREPSLRDGVGRIYSAWRHHLEVAIRDGVDSGRFSPVLPVDDVLDVLLTIVDGCELNVAAEMVPIDGTRMRTLVLGTAAVLLGIHDCSSGR